MEGLTLTMKPDSKGRTAIGYGHDLILLERYPEGITKEFAEVLIKADVTHCEVVLNYALNKEKVLMCTQNQFDALIDFTYECGPGALAQLLAHGWEQIVHQLPRWIHTHDEHGNLKTLPGMIERRALEIKLFEA